MSLELRSASLTKQGDRSCNEDALGERITAADACLVVSDGAGGHGGGDVASRVAVAKVLDTFEREPQVDAEHLLTLLDRANQAVLEGQTRDVQLADMRATLVVLLIDRRQDIVLWAHSGDSRAYCFRGGRILHQTLDHSVLQNMVAAGYAEPTALRTHPQRGKLLSALGSAESLRVSVASQPLALREGDVFLLCSDGLWEYVEETRMAQLLVNANSPQAWLQALETEVLAHARPNHDNYSAITLWVDEADQSTLIFSPDRG